MSVERRILLLEDDPNLGLIVAESLENRDFMVRLCRNGREGLAALEEEQPDLCLVDVMMPELDGFEFARHLRNDERFHDIPIIMVTSRTGEKHRERAMELAIESYLGKPFQEDELLENIAELVGDKSQRA